MKDQLRIALYSSFPRMGKSTVAEMLRSYCSNSSIYRFSNPIKVMMYSLFDYCGIDDSFSYIEGHLKENEALFGLSSRYMMQTLGTEWGRNCLCESFWTSLLLLEVNGDVYSDMIIVDDMRFPNEYEALKREGFIMVRVHKPDVHYDTIHPSEGSLDGHEFDYLIENDGTLEDLEVKIENLLKELTK